MMTSISRLLLIMSLLTISTDGKAVLEHRRPVSVLDQFLQDLMLGQEEENEQKPDLPSHPQQPQLAFKLQDGASDEEDKVSGEDQGSSKSFEVDHQPAESVYYARDLTASYFLLDLLKDVIDEAENVSGEDPFLPEGSKEQQGANDIAVKEIQSTEVPIDKVMKTTSMFDDISSSSTEATSTSAMPTTLIAEPRPSKLDAADLEWYTSLLDFIRGVADEEDQVRRRDGGSSKTPGAAVLHLPKGSEEQQGDNDITVKDILSTEVPIVKMTKATTIFDDISSSTEATSTSAMPTTLIAESRPSKLDAADLELYNSLLDLLRGATDEEDQVRGRDGGSSKTAQAEVLQLPVESVDDNTIWQGDSTIATKVPLVTATKTTTTAEDDSTTSPRPSGQADQPKERRNSAGVGANICLALASIIMFVMITFWNTCSGYSVHQ